MDEQVVDLRLLRREAQYPSVIDMIIDGKSRAQIARDVGVTERTISEWIRTPEFQSLWQEVLVTNTSVWKEAATMAIADMLPKAVEQHRNLLNAPETSDSVRWNVVRHTYEMVGIDNTAVDGKDQLREFLRKNQVNITHIDHALIVDGAVDPGFLQALSDVMPRGEPLDVVDGVFTELE